MYTKKRYDKKKIDLLFRQYVETSDEGIFEQLIEACDPIIEIVLAKYGKYRRHFADIKQEIRLKMWKNMRNPKRLHRCSVSPSIYLFFVIRAYVAKAFESFMRIYEDDKETLDLVECENWVIGVTQNVFLTPEEQYVVRNEIPQELFQRFVRKLKEDKRFNKTSREIQRIVIKQYKKEIESVFATRLDNPDV